MREVDKILDRFQDKANEKPGQLSRRPNQAHVTDTGGKSIASLLKNSAQIVRHTEPLEWTQILGPETDPSNEFEEYPDRDAIIPSVYHRLEQNGLDLDDLPWDAWGDSLLESLAPLSLEEWNTLEITIVGEPEYSGLGGEYAVIQINDEIIIKDPYHDPFPFWRRLIHIQCRADKDEILGHFNTASNVERVLEILLE